MNKTNGNMILKRKKEKQKMQRIMEAKSLVEVDASHTSNFEKGIKRGHIIGFSNYYDTG